MVKEKIGQTLSSLSIFSQNLAEKMRQEQQKQEALKQAELGQILEAASKLSSAHLMITLFLVTAELIIREQPLPETATTPLTPVLQKIKDEHITSQQIKGLSQAELNRLVFDSASIESLGIVERLAAEHKGTQLGFGQ